jgi:hypothetical protein
MKIPEVAHIFGLFVQMLSLSINVGKKGLDYILGNFFTNSYGHPSGDGGK